MWFGRTDSFFWRKRWCLFFKIIEWDGGIKSSICCTFGATRWWLCSLCAGVLLYNVIHLFKHFLFRVPVLIVPWEVAAVLSMNWSIMGSTILVHHDGLEQWDVTQKRKNMWTKLPLRVVFWCLVHFLLSSELKEELRRSSVCMLDLLPGLGPEHVSTCTNQFHVHVSGLNYEKSNWIFICTTKCVIYWDMKQCSLYKLVCTRILLCVLFKASSIILFDPGAGQKNTPALVSGVLVT